MFDAERRRVREAEATLSGHPLSAFFARAPAPAAPAPAPAPTEAAASSEEFETTVRQAVEIRAATFVSSLSHEVSRLRDADQQALRAELAAARADKEAALEQLNAARAAEALSASRERETAESLQRALRRATELEGRCEEEERKRAAAEASAARLRGERAALEPLALETLEVLERNAHEGLAAIQAAMEGRRESERQCAVCMERPKNTVFECGHRVCDQCAGRLQACPTCRAVITTRIRVFD